MKEGNIDLSGILEKVNSKYMLVMVTARRSRQLALMEQKEKVMESGNPKAKIPEGASELGYLTDEERNALKAHKPIVVALNELLEDKITYHIKEEE